MNKRKHLIILILLGIFFINSGCTRAYSQKQLDKMEDDIQKNNTLPYMTGGGVSIGLYNSDGKIEETKLFNIKKGETFKKLISVGNMIDNERDYKIILFVDYKQYPFTVDGNSVSEYDFNATKNENVLTPIEIDNLQEGFHDVFFVVIKYPTYKSLDEDFRASTDMNNLIFIRFNIDVENGVSPIIDFDKFENVTPTVFDGLFLSKEKDKLRRWGVEEASTLSKVDFYIHAGNETYDDNQEFAVITLLDWKQVAFCNNQDVVFINVSKGEKICIPASINTPGDSGVYDLVSILIHNPYEPLDIKNCDIETGIRVGIDVR